MRGWAPSSWSQAPIRLPAQTFRAPCSAHRIPSKPDPSSVLHSSYLPMALVTHRQPWSKNIKGKIAEINNSFVLNHQTNCHSVTVPVSKSRLSYSLRAPKRSSSDPSSSNTPKRSGEVLPLSMTYRNKQYIQGQHCLHFHASTGGLELYPQQIRGGYGVMMFTMIKAPV